MATNFSPCKGSYVLNQFPSNVMFGMNGFHVSASGAIQGHHGPLGFAHLMGRISLKYVRDVLFWLRSTHATDDSDNIVYLLQFSVVQKSR